MNAQSLNELQQIGKNISATTKYCTELIAILDRKISIKQSELEKIQKEKNLKETKYMASEQAVQDKQEELSKCFENILEKSNSLIAAKESYNKDIVDNCVKRYKNGEYPNKALKDVIAEEISSNGNFNVSLLSGELSKANSLSDEIQDLCSDIEVLVSEIRTVNMNYKNVSDELTSSISHRKQLMTLGQTAANNYQSGYAKRIELRNSIIQKYSTTATADEKKITTSENPQIQKLADFLDQSELDKMPYSDAWVIMKETFNNCGIVYDEETKEMTIPWGDDSAAINIFKALDDALYQNYGVNTNRPRYNEEDNQKVYVIAAYNNSCWQHFYGDNKLTLGENIKDFAGANAYARARNMVFSGSGRHDHDKGNNEELMTLYNKMSDEVKNLVLQKGEAYIIREDGTLVGTVAADQLGKAYYNFAAYRSDQSVYNDEFSVLESLNVDGGFDASEEGSGGVINLGGTAYNVALTVFRKETPLILDLKGDGLNLTDVSGGVNFDLNADGKIDRTAWTKAHTDFDDAFLVLDKNGDGQINDGKELFGSQNGAVNGFAELAKYDDNNDGKIDENDEAYKKLQLWSDMNGDGKVDDGELRTLDEMGVKEIATNYEEKRNSAGSLLEDKNGNTIGLQGSFTTTDGTTNKMTDVLFNTMDLDMYNKINSSSSTSEIKRQESTNFFTNETFSFDVENKQYRNPFSLVDRHEKAIKIDNTDEFNNAIRIIEHTDSTIKKDVETPLVSKKENPEEKKKQLPEK